MAPFYDLVNTTSYTRLSKEFAFHVGGDRSPGQLTPASWERQARELEVSPRLVLREVSAMLQAVDQMLEPAREETAKQLGDGAQLVQFVQAIRKGIRWVGRSLGKPQAP